MLPGVTCCGMVKIGEIVHATNESIPNHVVPKREARTDSACRQIYVTVLSGDPGQNDPARRRGIEQRRNCGLSAYTPRNRKLVAKALFRRTTAGTGRSSASGPASDFSPQSWLSRSRRWRVNLQQHTTCRCRALVWRMWRGKLSIWGWSPPSATARYGAGSMRTRFDLGNIAAGFFRAIRSLPSRRDGSWTFTSASGRVRHCAAKITCCPPTRRRVSKRARVYTQPCPPSQDRQCASSMNTSAAERGLIWLRSMSIAPKCSAVASPRVVSRHSVGWSIKSCGNRRTAKPAGCFGSWTMVLRIAAPNASPDCRKNIRGWFPFMVLYMPVGSIKSKSTSLSCNARHLLPTTFRRWPQSKNDYSPSKRTTKRLLVRSSGNSLGATLPSYSTRSIYTRTHNYGSQRDQ